MKVYVVMNTESYHESVDKIFLRENDAKDYMKDDPYKEIEEREVIE